MLWQTRKSAKENGAIVAHHTDEPRSGAKPFPSNVIDMIGMRAPILQIDALKSGDHIAKNVRAFWQNPDCVAQYQFDDNGNHVFKANKSFGDFFSLSWQINANELEEISETDPILSIGCAGLKGKTRALSRPQKYARLGLIISGEERHWQRRAMLVDGYWQTGFSRFLDEIPFEDATRAWIDLIFTNLNTSNLQIEKPMVFVQNQILI